MRSFAETIYSLLRSVPPGRVTTYKALANAAHSKAYRAVGRCMKNNPYSFESCADPAKQIPCHRVVASNGTIGGFMGTASGKEIIRKIALLHKEGVRVINNRIVDFESICFLQVSDT